METFFKYLCILIVSSSLVLSVLLLVSDVEDDSVCYENRRNESYDENEGISMENVFENLNYIPDAEESSKIKSLAGLNALFWYFVFLTPAVYAYIMFLFKRYSCNMEIIAFGVYSALTLVFLYNIFLFVNFQSWNMKYAFEMLLTGTGIGLASALYSVSVCTFIELLSILKEDGITFYELVIGKYHSPNAALCLSFARSWFLFAVLISGLVLTLMTL